MLNTDWFLQGGYNPLDASGNVLGTRNDQYIRPELQGLSAMDWSPEQYQSNLSAIDEDWKNRLSQLIGSGQVKGAVAANPTSQDGRTNLFDRFSFDSSGNPVAMDPLQQYEQSGWTSFRDQGLIPFAATVAGANALAGLFPAVSSAPITNAALIESSLGTAGYGASSAGLGGGAAASVAAPLGIDYGLASAPNALGGGALGGTSNGMLGGLGKGLTAATGPGLTLAAPTGTGAGLTATSGLANILGGKLGNSLPAVGQSLLSPAVQQLGNAVRPGIPGGTPSASVPNSSNPGGSRGNSNMGFALGNILGLLAEKENKKDYDELLGKIDGLYSTDSPYARQMQDELDRRDSAAGRGSQYGSRAVELAAKLTDSRRQALGQMTTPLTGRMLSRSMAYNNLNNVLTGGGNPSNPNILDTARDVVDWGSNAWDWVKTTFPDIFGD
jgi:hypothetical protein